MFFIRTAPSTSLLSSARAHLEKCGVRVDTGRSSRRAAASAQRMRAVEVAVIQELRGTSPYSCLERRLAVAAPPLFNLVARAHPARRSTVLHACNSHEGGGETERFTIFFSSFPSFHPPLARSPRLSGQKKVGALLFLKYGALNTELKISYTVAFYPGPSRPPLFIAKLQL